MADSLTEEAAPPPEGDGERAGGDAGAAPPPHAAPADEGSPAAAPATSDAPPVATPLAVTASAAAAAPVTSAPATPTPATPTPATPAALAPKPAAPAHPAPIAAGAGPVARPAARRSPYDHLLRVRGDVDGTNAIAIFLAGATAFLVLWALLTAGGPDPRSVKLTLGPDGRAELPRDVKARTHVWVQGYSEAAEGAAALADDEFRVVRGSPAALELSPAAAGAEVDVGYDLGHDPIVSNFLLPKPTDVMAGMVELVSGAAYQARCATPACGRADPIPLSASVGQALEAHRAAPDATPAPTVTCPRCNAPLAGTALAIPTSAQGFRGGIKSTLWRTTLGFFVAAAVCLPLGVLAGAFPPVKRFISPLEIAGGYAPPVAILPLAAAASGFLVNSGVSGIVAENTARIGFLFLVIAFWLYPMVVKEIEAVDQVYVNTAYTLGATRGQVVLRVLVPVASGKLFGHLRATYAIGWASIILAEGYASSKIPGEFGIGFFMTEMQRRHNMVNYFSAVLAIIAVGIVIDYGFKLAGKRLFPWLEAR